MVAFFLFYFFRGERGVFRSFVARESIKIAEHLDPLFFPMGCVVGNPLLGVFYEEYRPSTMLFISHGKSPEDHWVNGIEKQCLPKGTFGLTVSLIMKECYALVEPSLGLFRISGNRKADRSNILAGDRATPRAMQEGDGNCCGLFPVDLSKQWSEARNLEVAISPDAGCPSGAEHEKKDHQGHPRGQSANSQVHDSCVAQGLLDLKADGE